MMYYRCPLERLRQFHHDTLDSSVIGWHNSYRNLCRNHRNKLKKKIYIWFEHSKTVANVDTYLCWHGSIRTVPFISKHNVHESSRTLNFRNCSRNRCRGSTILSCGFISAWPLKLSNSRCCGGYWNGSAPKLKRHCWNDINDAAAKKPSLEIEKLYIHNIGQQYSLSLSLLVKRSIAIHVHKLYFVINWCVFSGINFMID